MGRSRGAGSIKSLLFKMIFARGLEITPVLGASPTTNEYFALSTPAACATVVHAGVSSAASSAVGVRIRETSRTRGR
ncbi:hypothetical protein ACFYO1_13165 [Nocardia sp. NPDC006044]|uniref:hypothetical protein n=1 Tax=Nocardia sp. NPDC006044 TaxID=3364306 RepID=UPI0036C463CA